VSKLFKRTQKVNEAPLEHPQRSTDVLRVEELLETINRGVDDQVASLDPGMPEVKIATTLDALEVKIATALDAVKEGPSVGVVEFPADGYRQVSIPRTPGRLFFPEDEATPAPGGLEAYRSFRTRLLRLQAKRQFRTVAITSAAQNEGKTLTSANLALSCAQLSRFPLLLIDGDLRTHGASRCLGYDEGPGLADVLSGHASREEAVVATDIPNLHFLCAGDARKPAPELFSGALWREFIAWCHDHFKLVLVDCPPAFPLADFELISASCDGILVVARARVTSKATLERMLAQLDRHKLLGMTLNSANSYHDAYYYYGQRR
jgi:capsular exopolysaccharide synthesis family protein